MQQGQNRDIPIDNQLRLYRRTKRLTQEKLARRARITRQTISAIESGQYVPNTAVALRLATVLDCRVEDLFYERIVSDYLDVRPVHDAEETIAAGDRVHLSRINDRYIGHPFGPEHWNRIPADGLVRSSAPVMSSLDVEPLIDREAIDRTVVVVGCDPAIELLADHVRRAGAGVRLQWHQKGSLAALQALERDEAHIAGMHLRDSATGDYNVPYVRRIFGDRPVMVLSFSRWQQGMLLTPGRTVEIRGPGDLMHLNHRLVNREPGSGSRAMLDDWLATGSVDHSRLQGYDMEVRSHFDVARVVAYGMADAGPGILSAARAYGLDFLPLQEERYDLVIPAEHIRDANVQVVLDVLTTAQFRRDIDALGGYDSSVAGSRIAELGDW